MSKNSEKRLYLVLQHPHVQPLLVLLPHGLLLPVPLNPGHGLLRCSVPLGVVHVGGEGKGGTRQVNILPLQHVVENVLELGLQVLESSHGEPRTAQGGAALLRGEPEPPVADHHVQLVGGRGVPVQAPGGGREVSGEQEEVEEEEEKVAEKEKEAVDLIRQEGGVHSCHIFKGANLKKTG